MRGLLCVVLAAGWASGGTLAIDPPDQIRYQRLEEFQRADDYSNLAEEAHQAHAALEMASQRVLDHVTKTTGWQAAQDKLFSAQKDLARARENQLNHPEEVAAAVSNLMNARQSMRQIVAEVLNNDHDVMQARKKLAEVQARLDNLRRGFELTLQNDPQWLTARHEQVQDLAQPASASN